MHTLDQLRELRAALKNMRDRAGGVRHDEVAKLLDSIRVRRSGGKHPYVWKPLHKGDWPLSVPWHSQPIKPGTLRSILSVAEADIDWLEGQLAEEGPSEKK